MGLSKKDEMTKQKINLTDADDSMVLRTERRRQKEV